MVKIRSDYAAKPSVALDSPSSARPTLQRGDIQMVGERPHIVTTDSFRLFALPVSIEGELELPYRIHRDAVAAFEQRREATIEDDRSIRIGEVRWDEATNDGPFPNASNLIPGTAEDAKVVALNARWLAQLSDGLNAKRGVSLTVNHKNRAVIVQPLGAQSDGPVALLMPIKVDD